MSLAIVIWECSLNQFSTSLFVSLFVNWEPQQTFMGDNTEYGANLVKARVNFPVTLLHIYLVCQYKLFLIFEGWEGFTEPSKPFKTVHTTLVARNRDLSLADDNELLTNAAKLNNFHEVSQVDVKEFAYEPLSKSCCLDPLPASLLEDCFPVLLPTITRMVYLSLTTGFMPDALKIASLSLRLKKPTADFKQFSNFRPISNLKFISKLIEKSVAVQLTKHVMTNHLDETFQSAYKEFHSTETALLRVHNDILCSLDQNKSVILLLLDLSAAFDTVDHAILISRLSSRFGVKGTALAWFKCYLASRQQFVNVEGSMSSRRPLLRGVPQGSVLGPLLYLVYTAPIADIIKKHDLLYHLYADDTQLFISFNTDCCADIDEAKMLVERCVEEIDLWMCKNLLLLHGTTCKKDMY